MTKNRTYFLVSENQPKVPLSRLLLLLHLHKDLIKPSAVITWKVTGNSCVQWINFIIISAEDWPLKVNNVSFLDSSVTLHENSWRSFVFCWRQEVGNVTLLSHPDCDVFMCWVASSVSSIFLPSYSHVGVCRQSDVSTEQVKVTLSVSLCSVTVKERIWDVEIFQNQQSVTSLSQCWVYRSVRNSFYFRHFLRCNHGNSNSTENSCVFLH